MTTKSQRNRTGDLEKANLFNYLKPTYQLDSRSLGFDYKKPI